MIDVESKVFDTVYTQLTQDYPSVNVTAGYDPSDGSFPMVVVVEVDNAPYSSSNTDDCAENHTRLVYEVSVFSNEEDTGRGECKELLNAVDTIMQGMKFKRIHKNEPVNINRTLWRQYARYEVIVGKGITTTTGTGNDVVTTTTFQMYRR